MNIPELLYNDDYSSLDESAGIIYGNDGDTGKLMLITQKRINLTLYKLFPKTCISLLQEEIQLNKELIKTDIMNYFPQMFLSGERFLHLHNNVKSLEDRDRVMADVINSWSQGYSIEPIDKVLQKCYTDKAHRRIVTPYFYRPIPQELISKTITAYRKCFSTYPVEKDPLDRLSLSTLLFNEVKDIFNEYSSKYAKEIVGHIPTPPERIYVTHRKYWNINVKIRYLEQLITKIKTQSNDHFELEPYLLKELDIRNQNIFTFDQLEDPLQNDLLKAALERSKQEEQYGNSQSTALQWIGKTSDLERLYQVLVDTGYIENDDPDEFYCHFPTSIEEITSSKGKESDANKITWAKWNTTPDLVMLFMYLEKKNLIRKVDATIELYKYILEHFCQPDGHTFPRTTVKSAFDRILDKKKEIPSGKPRFLNLIRLFEEALNI